MFVTCRFVNRFLVNTFCSWTLLRKTTVHICWLFTGWFFCSPFVQQSENLWTDVMNQFCESIEPCAKQIGVPCSHTCNIKRIVRCGKLNLNCRDWQCECLKNSFTAHPMNVLVFFWFDAADVTVVSTKHEVQKVSHVKWVWSAKASQGFQNDSQNSNDVNVCSCCIVAPFLNAPFFKVWLQHHDLLPSTWSTETVSVRKGWILETQNEFSSFSGCCRQHRRHISWPSIFNCKACSKVDKLQAAIKAELRKGCVKIQSLGNSKKIIFRGLQNIAQRESNAFKFQLESLFKRQWKNLQIWFKRVLWKMVCSCLFQKTCHMNLRIQPNVQNMAAWLAWRMWSKQSVKQMKNHQVPCWILQTVIKTDQPHHWVHRGQVQFALQWLTVSMSCGRCTKLKEICWNGIQRLLACLPGPSQSCIGITVPEAAHHNPCWTDLSCCTHWGRVNESCKGQGHHSWHMTQTLSNPFLQVRSLSRIPPGRNRRQHHLTRQSHQCSQKDVPCVPKT